MQFGLKFLKKGVPTSYVENEYEGTYKFLISAFFKCIFFSPKAI